MITKIFAYDAAPILEAQRIILNQIIEDKILSFRMFVMMPRKAGQATFRKALAKELEKHG